MYECVKMHTFRLRYVVLGLLIYLQNAFCQSCGTKFADVSSKTLFADLVLQGEVIVLHPDRAELPNSIYSVTVKIKKAFKGEDFLGRSDKKRYRHIEVTSFAASQDPSACVGHVVQNSSYLFFLRASHNFSESHHDRKQLFRISALPESDSKKNVRDVTKIICRPTDKKKICGLEANGKVRPSKKTINQGEDIKLTCKGEGFPAPILTWFKDRQPFLTTDKRYRLTEKIRRRKSQSKLTIKRAEMQDNGTYECQIVNYYKNVTQSSQVIVKPAIYGSYCQDQSWCLNGGTCFQSDHGGDKYCKCAPNYLGLRCDEKEPPTGANPKPRRSETVIMYIPQDKRWESFQRFY